MKHLRSPGSHKRYHGVSRNEDELLNIVNKMFYYRYQCDKAVTKNDTREVI